MISATIMIELIDLMSNECDLHIPDIVFRLTVRLLPCAPFNRAET